VLRLEHVSHLVHEQEHNQPDPEPPAAEPDIERGGDEDREEELELEQHDAELGQERADRGERRPQAAKDCAPVPAMRLNRLVAAPPLGVLRHVSHCACG
jgi:hypothetical protein